MLVAPERALCVGIANQTCLVYTDRDDPAAPVEWSYDGFVGFTHRWGQTAEVDVEIEEIDDPPADGSSQRWTATRVRVVSEAAAGTTFTMRLHESSEPWFSMRDGVVRLLNSQPVVCASEVCAQIVVAPTRALAAVVAHDGQGGLEIRSVTEAP